MTNKDMWAATMIGAAIGGVTAYLFFTDRGRAFRRQIEPALENFVRELSSFRGTLQRTASVAAESWSVVTELLGEGSPTPARPYAGGQSAPF